MQHTQQVCQYVSGAQDQKEEQLGVEQIRIDREREMEHGEEDNEKEKQVVLDAAAEEDEGEADHEGVTVEVAAAAGITAIIAPAGSLKDADVIKRANELGVALYHAPERIFSHH